MRQRATSMKAPVLLKMAPERPIISARMGHLWMPCLCQSQPNKSEYWTLSANSGICDLDSGMIL